MDYLSSSHPERSIAFFLLGTVGVAKIAILAIISILKALVGVRPRLLADDNKLSLELRLPGEQLLPLGKLVLMELLLILLCILLMFSLFLRMKAASSVEP